MSIALAIAGVVTINLANGSAAGHGFASSLTGNLLLILGAVCCESIYVILSRASHQTLRANRHLRVHAPGLCLMLPLGATAMWHSITRACAGRLMGARVVWYGLSASISFWLWMSIRHVPGGLAGVFSAVLPVAAAAVWHRVPRRAPDAHDALALSRASSPASCWPACA